MSLSEMKVGKRSRKIWGLIASEAIFSLSSAFEIWQQGELLGKTKNYLTLHFWKVFFHEQLVLENVN